MAVVDTSAPLPDLRVDAGTTYTVTLNQAAAKITQLVIHGDQTAGEDITQLTLSDIYLTPSSGEVTAPETRQISPPDFGGPGG